MILSTGPEAVQNLFLSDATLTTLTATWLGPSSYFENFVVVVSEPGLAPIQEISLKPTEIRLLIENLQPGTEYLVEVFVTVGSPKLRSEPLGRTESTRKYFVYSYILS